MATSDDQKLTVLVVDDDPNAPSLCRGFTTFGKHRYEVSQSAQGGLKRLEQSGGGQFDLVLVDFELNDEWSALTFIEKAKSIRPDLPYFIWSSHSKDSIQHELNRLPLDLIFESRAAGFVEKNEVAADPRLLDHFIDRGFERFREQLGAQLHGTLMGVFSQLDVALSQTRAVRRSIQDLAGAASTGKRIRTATKPLRIRLHRVEATLCRTLGYRRDHILQFREAATEALDALLSRDLMADLPPELRAPLSNLARGAQGAAWMRSTQKLRDSLESLAKAEAAQQAVAEYVADLSEFMIYAGAAQKASLLSAEVWSSANSHFAFIPRLSCAVTHAFTLASCGDLSLAEHLVSAVLVEAEAELPDIDVAEISRSVFAEIDDFAKHASLQ